MHPMEYKKEKVGTGRFTHLILKNSLVFVGINFDEVTQFQDVLKDEEYDSYLLYPGDKTIDLSDPSAASSLSNRRKQFIVIDGTWPCAKKMMKLSTSLHALPRVSFKTTKISEFKIKHQPMPGCLSTVESIYQVIHDLNSLGVEQTSPAEENLLEVFRHTVKQQSDCAADPERSAYRKKPFSLPEERKVSKKWEKRLLFFRPESE